MIKRIGIMSLAVVLALGALGVAYAPWTDEVEITQTVQTGSLEIGVRADVELVGDDKGVASLDVTEGNYRFDKEHLGETLSFYDKVTVALEDWYPCVEAHEFFKIGVGGSVPLYMIADLEPDDNGLFDHMTFKWYMDLYRDGEWSDLGSGYGPANEEFPEIEALLECRQYYPCDILRLQLIKHLPQSAPQGASAEFTLSVTGIQYNMHDKNDNGVVIGDGKGTAMAEESKYPRHSWFQYVSYDGVEKTVNLVTGADLDKVGTVTFSAVDNDEVTITIALDPGYSLVEDDTKVSVKGYTDEQHAKDERNWPFCTWPYDSYPDVVETSFSIVVPANDGEDDYRFYAVHVNVELPP